MSADSGRRCSSGRTSATSWRILNAQLAWTHGSLTVTAYATNLANQHYVGALNSGLDFAGPPRQYGVKVLKGF